MRDRPIKPHRYKTKGDLTNGSIAHHLTRLTLPMVWGIFAVISVQIADTYFIGMLGTKTLAAISFTFPVTMILTHLLFGFNIAMASVASRLIGRNEMETVPRVVLHGLFLTFMTASIIALIVYGLHDPLFRLMGADDEMLDIIRQYMPLWLIGFTLLSIPSMGNSAIRAKGSALEPALVMSLISLVNLILDPILIFGKFGFPALGVQGAAIATVTGYSCGLIAGLYILIVRKKLLVPAMGLCRHAFKDSLRRLSFIAIPAGITNTIQPATNAVFISLLAGFGAEAVAAYGVATRIEAFAMILLISMATSMAPIIGQNFGAQNFDRVHKTITLTIIFNFIWSFTVAGIFCLFGAQIADAFTDDPAVIEIARQYLVIIPVSYAFGNLVFGWASTFNAVGRPERAFVMIVCKYLIFMIPALFIGREFGGIKGIFAAIACVNVFGGLLFHFISRRACARFEEQYTSEHMSD